MGVLYELRRQGVCVQGFGMVHTLVHPSQVPVDIFFEGEPGRHCLLVTIVRNCIVLGDSKLFLSPALHGRGQI